MDDFRTALSEELSELSAPPLTGLVEAAARDGRRARRRRTVTAAVGSVAALALTAGLLTDLVRDQAGAPPTAAAAPVPQSPAAESPVSTPSGLPLDVTPTGEMVPTTSRALLAMVARLLPLRDWKGSEYSVSNPGQQLVTMFNVTEPNGDIGMVMVTMLDGTPGACKPFQGHECSTDKRGQTVAVDTLKLPCDRTTAVTVTRKDDSRVQVIFGNCRLNESGYFWAPGLPVLTVDQATAIAGDPLLAKSADRALVDAAANAYLHAGPTR